MLYFWITRSKTGLFPYTGDIWRQNIVYCCSTSTIYSNDSKMAVTNLQYYKYKRIISCKLSFSFFLSLAQYYLWLFDERYWSHIKVHLIFASYKSNDKTSAIRKFPFLTSNKNVMRPSNIAKFVWWAYLHPCNKHWNYTSYHFSVIWTLIPKGSTNCNIS